MKKSTVGSKSTKVPNITVPIPFSFEERDRRKMENKAELQKRFLEQQKKDRHFRANPMPNFRVIDNNANIMQKSNFVKNCKVEEKEKEKKNDNLKNIEKMVEKEIVELVRKNSEFKATPIRKYKLIKISKSTEKLTEPQSPNWVYKKKR